MSELELERQLCRQRRIEIGEREYQRLQALRDEAQRLCYSLCVLQKRPPRIEKLPLMAGYINRHGVVQACTTERHERTDWHPEFASPDPETGEVALACGCGQEIRGVLSNGSFAVKSFDMSGEGSGTFMQWILKPALRESAGELEAVLIWEGGDSIEKLSVKDGAITETPIDL